MNSVFQIFLLLLFFIGAWEFWLLRVKSGVNHIENPFFTSVYFLFWVGILVSIFFNKITYLIQNPEPEPFIAIAIFFLVNALIYSLVKIYMEEPEQLEKKHPREYFLLMDFRYMLSKSFDILFQQTTIALLVLMLSEAGFGLMSTVIIFGIIFGFLHIPLLKVKGSFGGYYIVFSALSAIAFPIFILELNYGFVYTYIIHWLFYTLSGVFFWSHESHKLIKTRPK